VISKLHAKHPQDKTLQLQGPDTLAGRVPNRKIYDFYISLVGKAHVSAWL
jgi:hypothetical protein